MKLSTSAFCITFSLLGAQLMAETKSLKFTTGDWAPYIYEWNGTVHPERPGSSVEIVTRIMEELGYEYDFTILPFLRQIFETETGNYDAMVGVYMQEAPNLIFPDEPIGISRNCFFTSAESDWQYTGFDSLEGKKFAIVQGYIYGEVDAYIPNHQDQFLAILGSESNMMERLASLVEIGRVHAFIQDYEVALHHFESAGIKGKFKSVGCMRDIPITIGFSPKNKATPKRIAEFDRVFSELRDSGEIARILKKYGVEDWK